MVRSIYIALNRVVSLINNLFASLEKYTSSNCVTFFATFKYSKLQFRKTNSYNNRSGFVLKFEAIEVSFYFNNKIFTLRSR